MECRDIDILIIIWFCTILNNELTRFHKDSI